MQNEINTFMSQPLLVGHLVGIILALVITYVLYLLWEPL